MLDSNVIERSQMSKSPIKGDSIDPVEDGLRAAEDAAFGVDPVFNEDGSPELPAVPATIEIDMPF